MDRLSIREGDDPEVATQLPNIAPMPDATVPLYLPMFWRAQNAFDPFQEYVRPLAPHNSIEIAGGFHPVKVRQWYEWG